MALEGLGGLIRGLENQESWQVQKQFRLVLLHWPKSVGFAVARKTRPVGIQRGTLYVATETSAWAQTLSYERLNILRKLNRYQRLPLKSIRFSTAQWAQEEGSGKAIADMAIANIKTDTKTNKSRLSHHPSYIGEVPTLPTATSQQTPKEAFQRWASTLQQMQRNQSICLHCRCHCPQGELERWGRCALCATRQWR